jgi:hypothetical protein
LTAASLATDGGVEYDITFNATATSQDDLTLIVPANGAWHQTNLMTTTFTSTSTAGGTTTTNPDETYAAYLAAHSGATVSSVSMYFDEDACNTGNGVARVDIDDMVVGLSGVTTTYDFEPDNTSTVSVAAPKKTGYAADTLITGVVSEGGHGIANETVELMAEPKGASSYSDVRDVGSDYDGQIEATYRPRADTKFYWRFDGDAGVGRVSSPVVTVSVGSTITLHSFDRTVARSQHLDLFGSVTPSVTGRVITVYDRKGHRTAKLGRAVLGSDGLFTIGVTPPRGKSAVFAKVGASGHTPGATSNTVAVTRR